MLTKEEQREEARRLCGCMADVLGKEGKLEARDWKGFFGALASFISVIAPLIIPLFMEPEKK